MVTNSGLWIRKPRLCGTTVLRGRLGEPPFAAFGLRQGRVVAAVGVEDPTAERAA
jgi:3-phenylpropionate/trans-cinnamate dioxygenase ferredoxin reductase subunit